MSSTVPPLPDLVLRLDGATVVRSGLALIDGVSLEVRAGEHWALIGPNGAGKSTTLALCGAQGHPTSGTVEILGGRLGRVDVQELRRRIGHVNPRHGIDVPRTVLEVVLTGITGTLDLPPRWEPSAAETARARSLVHDLGLGEVEASRWPTLSQGERGRALIARALIAEPSLLLLDEPSTGLDVAAREQLLETVDRVRRLHPEVASILVTHHLEELPESTTHAALISHGRITASGEAAGVLTTELVSAAFDHPIEVRHDAGRWSARSVRSS
ncbi:ABC transporter ATP-binding protein [Homoserinibacter sp. YIM 151385]|uniref:ABC transporter ATP-binding protein n=1 Tax=Homoserinibacter sp. YIM 151385 TaxID=2985506 RepID=UPI0022F02F54|nr:ATP-binding cassette domain-containing protein [Homoserinibacter sp. YIM 151385]WBU37010.1 ATP-binding cassette domain-containing protein [Homoserinibacter sp. YIM 151385]